MKTRLAFIATIALAVGTSYAGSGDMNHSKSMNNSAENEWTSNGPNANPHKFRTQANSSMSMEQIKTAQTALKSEGFNVGPIDGRVGPKTRNAIMQFQSSYDLPTTGRLNQDTLDMLDVETNSEAYSE